MLRSGDKMHPGPQNKEAAYAFFFFLKEKKQQNYEHGGGFSQAGQWSQVLKLVLNLLPHLGNVCL